MKNGNNYFKTSCQRDSIMTCIHHASNVHVHVHKSSTSPFNHTILFWYTRHHKLRYTATFLWNNLQKASWIATFFIFSIIFNFLFKIICLLRFVNLKHIKSTCPIINLENICVKWKSRVNEMIYQRPHKVRILERSTNIRTNDPQKVLWDKSFLSLISFSTFLKHTQHNFQDH